MNNKTITFEAASHYDEVREKIEKFREIVSKAASNTVFQLMYNDILDECYDMMDFIIDGNISETLIDKIDALSDKVNARLNDEDFIKAIEYFKH